MQHSCLLVWAHMRYGQRKILSNRHNSSEAHFHHLINNVSVFGRIKISILCCLGFIQSAALIAIPLLVILLFSSILQVLFLMYHYFAAAEIYNAIRMFIAAYVWMTGFGNFSYYYVRKDFSLGRFAQVCSCLNQRCLLWVLPQIGMLPTIFYCIFYADDVEA